MPKYIYNGKEFSEDEVFAAAERKGMSVDQYIIDYGIQVVEDPMEVSSFQTGPVEETVAAGPQKIETVATASMPASGSLVLQDGIETQEQSTWLEDTFGKDTIGVDFISDIYRAAKQGWVQAEALDASLALYSKGPDLTDAEFKELIEAGRAIEELGQTDEQIKFSEDYAKLKEEYGGVGAFVAGWWKNPTVMAQYTASSLANMARSSMEAEALAAGAAGAGTMALSGAAVGSVAPGIGNIIGGGAGLVGGFMGGVGAVMETGATTAQLIQEAAQEQGKDWAKMSDQERINWVKTAVADEESFNEIKNKALARGLTIGAIDAITGVVSGGAGKAARMAATGAVKAGIADVATTAAVETVGGMASEIGGQLAAGQELDAQEILTEGFADKTFTAVNILKGGLKGPTYKINGETLSGNKFAETIKMMDDVAITEAEINVDNDPVMEKIISNRREDIRIDLDTDARVNNVDDRAKIIELQRKVDNLKNNNTVSGQKQRNDATQQIKDILDKYKDSEVDVTIKDRQKAVAKARKNALENSFNKNVEKVSEVAQKIGFDKPIKVVRGQKALAKTIAEDTGQSIEDVQKALDDSLVEGVYAGDGRIYIDKNTALKMGNVNVASHELLHPVLNALVGNKESQGEIVGGIKKLLNKKQLAWVENELNTNYAPEEHDLEFLTVFSNGIQNGDIKYEESVFDQIKSFIEPILQKLGFENINFDNAKGVYNFLKEYNTTINSEQGLSAKAFRAIEKAETAKGVKVSEAPSIGIQASKKLAPEVSNTVAEKIQEINKLEQEGKDIATKYNKEFIKSGKQQRLENELSQLISPAVEALAESTTKRLYDRIATEQKRNVSREEYKQALKTDWLAMIKNEYDATKQDVETFLSTRGNLRANSLAKELGIESEQTGGIKADVTEQKALTTDDQTSERIDEDAAEARREAKLIDPTTLIKDEKLREKYINTVKSRIKDLDVENLSFKELKDLAAEVTAEIFNVDVKKITDPKANLASGDLSTIQNFINQNADALLKLLPEGGITQDAAASKRLQGTATGVPGNLKKAFYDPKPRGTKGAGLAIQKKRKGITRSEFLEVFGIVDGKKLPGLSPRGPQAQAMKGLINLFGRQMTNTIVRQELSKNMPKKMLVYNASPKSFDQLGERTGLIFLATDKKEAQAYADMNRGEVKDIYIDENTIASEKEALSVMKELGIDTTEGNLYELIDPRFEEFYIGKTAVNQVTDALANKGFKAIKYEDGGQVSKSTESIVVFDKSAITDQQVTESNIQDIAAGKSELQLSKKKRLERSKKYGLEKDHYDLDSNEGIQKYLVDLENVLLPIFGPEFIKPYMLLDRRIVGENITKKEFDDYRKQATKIIAAYKKNNEQQQWEIQKAGVNSKKSSSFFSLGMGKPENEFGITPKEIEQNIKNGKIKMLNQKYSSIFDEMWYKIEKAIEKNPKAVIPIQLYLASASYVTAHPLRRGAEFIFYSKNPKGFKNQKGKFRTYEYEHAVQSHYIRDTLLDAAMEAGKNKDGSFQNVLQKEKENYKLIALDAVDNEKLNKAGFKYYMPDGWKHWWQRYFNDKVSKIDGGINPESLVSTINEGKTLQQELKIKDSAGFQLSKKTIQNQEKTLDKQFNDILENKTGIASDKEISAAKAKVVGASKGKFNWFIPPTAEDFVGLLYQFLGKGALGDKQMAWFKVNLLDPYAKAMSAISRDRNSLARNYRALKKELKIVPKNLKKEVPGEGFTKEQAVRVYIWTKQGYEIPGLSKTDAAALRKFVNADPQLKEFGDKLILLNKNEYAKPKDGWTAGTITTDLLESLNEGRRAEHLSQWQANVDIIFSEKNLNKIEAEYGSSFRYALENILTRMKTGRNRTYGTDSLTGRVTDWLTNSIGAIMFFNTRSAILQTISAVNFINFGDNNLLAAGKAFANQKQYWSDFLKLYNSDFLVDRRDGLRLNVNESDIADMAKKGGVKGVISELLKLGFTPTQIADSFAIASGGSTFYRNRIKTYLKEGMDQKAAEEKAFQDFRETAEESQQSSRPDKISAQQAGPLGRIILAFANTPAQYARLMKKAFLDLKNGRGDAKTNISKLIYYGAVQNLVFNAMQQALFGMMFEEEEEEEDKEKKIINTANNMADSILRGMGISGAIFSVLKNTVKKLIEQSEKKQPKYAENAITELLKISPPISSKASKVKNALRSYEWDKDEMYEKGLALDNPAYLAAGNILSASTNIPLDRAVKKVTNVKDAMSEDLELWQRIALLGGWSAWELGIDKKNTQKTKSKKSSTSTKLGRNTKL